MSNNPKKYFNQPIVSENQYGSSMSIENIYIGDSLYIGDNRNAKPYLIISINRVVSTNSKPSYMIDVLDEETKEEYTLMYNENSRVSTKLNYSVRKSNLR